MTTSAQPGPLPPSAPGVPDAAAVRAAVPITAAITAIRIAAVSAVAVQRLARFPPAMRSACR